MLLGLGWCCLDLPPSFAELGPVCDGLLETSPPPTGGFGPFGPEVSQGVSERVSPKIGVSEGVSGPRVSKRCPERARRVSETPPPDTLSDTPIFGDTLSDTPRDTWGPKPPVGGWGCLNGLNSGHKKGTLCVTTRSCESFFAS